jgi:hypothetical protein
LDADPADGRRLTTTQDSGGSNKANKGPHTLTGSEPPSTERSDLFTRTEQQLLQDVVKSAVADGSASPTPRQIRSFLAKYQLARALRSSQINSDPLIAGQLAERLAQAFFRDNIPARAKEDERFAINVIVAEVV